MAHHTSVEISKWQDENDDRHLPGGGEQEFKPTNRKSTDKQELTAFTRKIEILLIKHMKQCNKGNTNKKASQYHLQPQKKKNCTTL